MEDSKEPSALLPLPEAASVQIIRQAPPAKEQAGGGDGGDGGDIDVPLATTEKSQRQDLWYACSFPNWPNSAKCNRLIPYRNWPVWWKASVLP